MRLRTAGLRVLVLLLLLAATLIGAAVLGRGFDRGWQLPFGVAAAVGLVAGALAGRFRLAGPLVALLVLVGAVPLVVALTRPAALLGPTGYRDAARDCVLGLGRLVTTGVPAPAEAALLALPIAVCWAAAAAAGWAALSRTGPALPLLPPLVLLAAGLALTVPTGGPGLLAAAGFVLIGLVIVAVRTPQPAGAPVLLPLPVLAAVCALGLAAGTAWVPARARFDPRPHLALAPQVRVQGSPTFDLKPELLRRPRQALFRVRLSGPPPTGPLLLRTAAMQHFDGGVWRIDEAFTRPAARYPATAGPGRELGLDVTVLQPRLWLPSAGQVTGVRGQGVLLGPSGTLIAEHPAGGLRYSLTALVPSRPRQLTGATADPAAVRSGALALPSGSSSQLQGLALRLTWGARTPVARLTALEAALRALPYDTGAPPGESIGTITMMIEERSPYDESFAQQRAAAFAALARALGLPSRVVFGYRLAAAGPAERTVTTADADAWPEVALAGRGWVPFDPTDRTRRRGVGTGGPPTGPLPDVTPTGPPQPPSRPSLDPSATASPPSSPNPGSRRPSPSGSSMSSDASSPSRSFGSSGSSPPTGSPSSGPSRTGSSAPPSLSSPSVSPSVSPSPSVSAPPSVFQPSTAPPPPPSGPTTAPPPPPSGGSGGGGESEGRVPPRIAPPAPSVQVPLLRRVASPTWPWWLLLATLAALLIGFEAVAAAKALRRVWRRRARSDRRRLAGAWAEVLDRLRERGLRPPASATPAEVAAGATTPLGAGPTATLHALAEILDEAVYSPSGPTPEAATRAWELEGEFRTALRQRTPVWRDRLHQGDPRGLLRRRRVVLAGGASRPG